MQSYELGLYVFMLAAFLGFELVKRVSPLLHTPLMSLTNAISAISVVGAILVSGAKADLRQALEPVTGIFEISETRSR